MRTFKFKMRVGDQDYIVRIDYLKPPSGRLRAYFRSEKGMPRILEAPPGAEGTMEQLLSIAEMVILGERRGAWRRISFIGVEDESGRTVAVINYYPAF